MKILNFFKFVIGFSIALVSLESFSDQLYSKAEVGADNNLHIYTASGKQIVIEKKAAKEEEGGPVGFEQINISSDHRSVGWVSMYDNCCTSYPIPLGLNIYTEQQEYSFTGVGLPIWRWGFESNGQYVAFYQETVHGGFGSHYELREIKTNRLVDSFEPKRDQNDQPIENQKIPAWVERLEKKQ